MLSKFYVFPGKIFRVPTGYHFVPYYSLLVRYNVILVREHRLRASLRLICIIFLRISGRIVRN